MTAFELTDKQSDLAKNILSVPAKHSLIYGGSRSGKTFLYCWAISQRAIKAPGSRHVVFRKHNVAVKQSVGMDTLRKVLKLAFPEVPFKWYEQDGYFKLPNDSEIWLAGLDDKDRVEKVLGKEYATLYFNEASEIPYQSYIIAQTRLSQKVERFDGKILPLKSYVDLNPTTRHHWTYRLYVDGVEPESNQLINVDDYVWGVANPKDNADNLNQDYLDSLQALPERARKRFWDGEFSGDAENALWRRDTIQRINPKIALPDFKRVVVAIDPAVSNNQGSDETGIIVAALGADGNGYVLADDSGKYRPEEWARKAIQAYHAYSADRIVAEVNNGGDMIESVIRSQAKNISFQSVRATRGKSVRAEPIASLYERGKIYHVGEFPALEDQMCTMTIDFDPKTAGYSPDRVDALVWAMTALFPDMVRDKSTSEIEFDAL